MPLNHSQKKFIKKNYRRLTVDQIAKNLAVDTQTVVDYMQERWGDINITTEQQEESIHSPIATVKEIIKKKWYMFVVFFAVIVITYANGMFNQFLSDDITVIVENPHVKEFSYVFANPHTFLRTLLYFIFYKLFGLTPFFFRLINIFFHTGNTILVYIILSILSTPVVAALTALIFAVHPITVEAVTWISGGPYPQYSFFLLLSLLLYILGKEKKWLYFTSLVSFFFALVSSHMALVFPGILFLYEWIFGSLAKNWKRLIPFIIVGGIWILLYINLIDDRTRVLQKSHYQEGAYDNVFIKTPISIVSYFRILFWPVVLSFYYSELVFTPQQYTIYVILFLIYAGITVFSYFNNKKIFFWLAFFFITLTPTLTPFRISWVIAERYAYLGAIGIIFVFAYFFHKYLLKKKDDPTGYLIFAVILCLLITRSFIRNFDWKSIDELSLSTAKTSPSDPKTHNNLGDLYARRGDYQKSVEEFSLAIKLNPRYADAYHNLANTYEQMGRTDLAIQNYEKALEFNPSLWQTNQALAVIYYKNKDLEKAFSYMKHAIELAPNEASLHVNIGIMYLQTGNKEAAKVEFTKAYQLNPDDQRAQLGLQEVAK